MLLQACRREWAEFRLLLRSVPASAVTLFVLSVFSMNLLANKSLALPFDWLALDGGIFVSWFAFLSMDVLTKRFGPKAATELSVFALGVDLLFCLLFFLVSRIPGAWGESFVEGQETLLNNALDNTFGGTWYVLLGSALAFLVSALINNSLNHAIGKAFRKNPNGVVSYVCSTYGSTAVGQFADNLLFALLVSHSFFGWSLTQCVTCALSGMAAELLCEVLFSAFGYRVCKRWEAQNVGEAYLHRKETGT